MSGLFDVSKETILVTGASQGLGRQFARVLSAHGAAVVAGGAPDRQAEEPGGRRSRAPAAAPPRCRMDVTDLASIAQAIDGAEAALGPVSVLINNAGIAVEKLAVDQTEADWDAVIDANLKGAYFAATEMARRMIARKQGGNIVNIASVLGFGVMKFLSPYAISKAGIVQATKALALELAGQQHPRQRAGAGLYRHRDEPRVLGDAGRRETGKADSAAPDRHRIRSRRRDPAAGLECLALHDRQRGHGRRRVLADVVRDGLASPPLPSFRDAPLGAGPESEVVANRDSGFARRCRGARPGMTRVDQFIPQLVPDHVGGLLADHDGRRVGVAADQGRHHRGIDHAQALDAAHFQLRIDHGHRSSTPILQVPTG